MILGSVCLGLACLAAGQAIRRRKLVEGSDSELIRVSTYSPIEWRLHQQARQTWYRRWLHPLLLIVSQRLHLKPARIDPLLLTQAGLDGDQIDAVEIRAVRLMSGVAGGGIGCLLAVFLSGTFTLVPVLAWIGYVAPIRVLIARKKRRQANILADLPELISMVRAFLAAGMPLERALHVLSTAGPPDSPLKQEIRRALAGYGLGLSIEQALEELGQRTGVDDLMSFATALGQSKRAGIGSDPTLRDLELMVRMNRRNQATANASSVSTKLLGVLAGIYLPEFVILIVVPLFWGIMQRAFG